MLDHLEADHPKDREEVETLLVMQMSLLHLVEPEFRIGQMGIGFDETGGYVVIFAYELAIEEGQHSGGKQNRRLLTRDGESVIIKMQIE